MSEWRSPWKTPRKKSEEANKRSLDLAKLIYNKDSFEKNDIRALQSILYNTDSAGFKEIAINLKDYFHRLIGAQKIQPFYVQDDETDEDSILRNQFYTILQAIKFKLTISDMKTLIETNQTDISVVGPLIISSMKYYYDKKDDSFANYSKLVTNPLLETLQLSKFSPDNFSDNQFFLYLDVLQVLHMNASTNDEAKQILTNFADNLLQSKAQYINSNCNTSYVGLLIKLSHLFIQFNPEMTTKILIDIFGFINSECSSIVSEYVTPFCLILKIINYESHKNDLNKIFSRLCLDMKLTQQSALQISFLIDTFLWALSKSKMLEENHLLETVFFIDRVSQIDTSNYGIHCFNVIVGKLNYSSSNSKLQIMSKLSKVAIKILQTFNLSFSKIKYNPSKFEKEAGVDSELIYEEASQLVKSIENIIFMCQNVISDDIPPEAIEDLSQILFESIKKISELGDYLEDFENALVRNQRPASIQEYYNMNAVSIEVDCFNVKTKKLFNQIIEKPMQILESERIGTNLIDKVLDQKILLRKEIIVKFEAPIINRIMETIDLKQDINFAFELLDRIFPIVKQNEIHKKSSTILLQKLIEINNSFYVPKCVYKLIGNTLLNADLADELIPKLIPSDKYRKVTKEQFELIKIVSSKAGSLSTSPILIDLLMKYAENDFGAVMEFINANEDLMKDISESNYYQRFLSLAASNIPTASVELRNSIVSILQTASVSEFSKINNLILDVDSEQKFAFEYDGVSIEIDSEDFLNALETFDNDFSRSVLKSLIKNCTEREHAGISVQYMIHRLICILMNTGDELDFFISLIESSKSISTVSKVLFCSYYSMYSYTSEIERIVSNKINDRLSFINFVSDIQRLLVFIPYHNGSVTFAIADYILNNIPKTSIDFQVLIDFICQHVVNHIPKLDGQTCESAFTELRCFGKSMQLMIEKCKALAKEKATQEIYDLFDIPLSSEQCAFLSRCITPMQKCNETVQQLINKNELDKVGYIMRRYSKVKNNFKDQTNTILNNSDVQRIPYSFLIANTESIPDQDVLIPRIINDIFGRDPFMRLSALRLLQLIYFQSRNESKILNEVMLKCEQKNIHEIKEPLALLFTVIPSPIFDIVIKQVEKTDHTLEEITDLIDILMVPEIMEFIDKEGKIELLIEPLLRFNKIVKVPNLQRLFNSSPSLMFVYFMDHISNIEISYPIYKLMNDSIFDSSLKMSIDSLKDILVHDKFTRTALFKFILFAKGSMDIKNHDLDSIMYRVFPFVIDAFGRFAPSFDEDDFDCVIRFFFRIFRQGIVELIIPVMQTRNPYVITWFKKIFKELFVYDSNIMIPVLEGMKVTELDLLMYFLAAEYVPSHQSSFNDVYQYIKNSSEFLAEVFKSEYNLVFPTSSDAHPFDKIHIYMSDLAIEEMKAIKVQPEEAPTVLTKLQQIYLRFSHYPNIVHSILRILINSYRSFKDCHEKIAEIVMDQSLIIRSLRYKKITATYFTILEDFMKILKLGLIPKNSNHKHADHTIRLMMALIEAQYYGFIQSEENPFKEVRYMVNERYNAGKLVRKIIEVSTNIMRNKTKVPFTNMRNLFNILAYITNDLTLQPSEELINLISETAIGNTTLWPYAAKVLALYLLKNPGNGSLHKGVFDKFTQLQRTDRVFPLMIDTEGPGKEKAIANYCAKYASSKLPNSSYSASYFLSEILLITSADFFNILQSDATNAVKNVDKKPSRNFLSNFILAMLNNPINVFLQDLLDKILESPGVVQMLIEDSPLITEKMLPSMGELTKLRIMSNPQFNGKLVPLDKEKILSTEDKLSSFESMILGVFGDFYPIEDLIPFLKNERIDISIKNGKPTKGVLKMYPKCGTNIVYGPSLAEFPPEAQFEEEAVFQMKSQEDLYKILKIETNEISESQKTHIDSIITKLIDLKAANKAQVVINTLDAALPKTGDNRTNAFLTVFANQIKQKIVNDQSISFILPSSFTPAVHELYSHIANKLGSLPDRQSNEMMQSQHFYTIKQDAFVKSPSSLSAMTAKQWATSMFSLSNSGIMKVNAAPIIREAIKRFKPPDILWSALYYLGEEPNSTAPIGWTPLIAQKFPAHAHPSFGAFFKECSPEEEKEDNASFVTFINRIEKSANEIGLSKAIEFDRQAVKNLSDGLPPPMDMPSAPQSSLMVSQSFKNLRMPMTKEAIYASSATAWCGANRSYIELRLQGKDGLSYSYSITQNIDYDVRLMTLHYALGTFFASNPLTQDRCVVSMPPPVGIIGGMAVIKGRARPLVESLLLGRVHSKKPLASQQYQCNDSKGYCEWQRAMNGSLAAITAIQLVCGMRCPSPLSMLVSPGDAKFYNTVLSSTTKEELKIPRIFGKVGALCGISADRYGAFGAGLAAGCIVLNVNRQKAEMMVRSIIDHDGLSGVDNSIASFAPSYNNQDGIENISKFIKSGFTAPDLCLPWI